MKSKIYNWMMDNLPSWLMYKLIKNPIWIHSPYKIRVPRWGWSKRQLKEAKHWQEDCDDNINWD